MGQTHKLFGKEIDVIQKCSDVMDQLTLWLMDFDFNFDQNEKVDYYYYYYFLHFLFFPNLVLHVGSYNTNVCLLTIKHMPKKVFLVCTSVRELDKFFFSPILKPKTAQQTTNIRSS